MGKVLGLVALIVSIMYIFLFDKFETPLILALAICGLVCILQMFRNLMGRGILATVLILICCSIPSLIAMYALNNYMELSEDVIAVVISGICVGVHLMYNSIWYTKNIK